MNENKPSVTGATTEPELIRVRIARARPEALDVRGFDLVQERGGSLPGFKAGAHVDVHITLPDRRRVVRSYSLCGPPSDQPYSYRIAVLYEEHGTGGSRHLHEGMREGYVLDIAPPKNYFELKSDATHTVLVAGGIGITPILAMAYELAEQDKLFELHYVARTADHMALRKEVEEAAGKRALFYFDGGNPANGMDLGVVLGSPAEGKHVYVCGPKGLIEATRERALARGYDEGAVHSEIFTPPAPLPGDGPITVIARRSGITVPVAKGTSILEALLAAGVKTDFDCKMGICGTCAAQVLEGTPDHRDSSLLKSERAAGKMCTCVSRALTPSLVLDL